MPIEYTPPSPNWIGSLGTAALTETPDSGQFNLSWGYKWTQKFEGYYGEIIGLANTGIYNRGTVSGFWIVNEARISRTRGQKGRLEIDWQSINTYLNPDEWSLTQEDLAPKIERHPLFQALLGTADLMTVRQAAQAQNASGNTTALQKFNGTNAALMTLLYNKMTGGMETYYLSGSHYTWSSYYLSSAAPSPYLGGVIQTPGGPAALLLPSDFAWLRLADNLGQANWSPLGGIVKLERHWIGAPSGVWDTDVYPAA